jgi:RNA polymerase sigma factor (sigma-70 family)
VDPVEYRPKRIRWVAGVAAVAVVVLFTVLSFGLHGSTGDGMGTFARGDQTAMIGLGVLIGLGILTLTRPRVRADAAGIKIRNVVGGYDLPWSVVRAVRFDRNSSWATLELLDDETVLGGLPDVAALEQQEGMLRRMEVQRAVGGLSVADRQLLALRYERDLTQPEVARMLGIPEGTVKIRLHRLRGRLRKALDTTV